MGALQLREGQPLRVPTSLCHRGNQIVTAPLKIRKIQPDESSYTDEVGELMTIRPIGLLNNLMFPALWTKQLWVYHRFQHREYNTYVGIEH
jgi:hypothetical protein